MFLCTIVFNLWAYSNRSSCVASISQGLYLFIRNISVASISQGGIIVPSAFICAISLVLIGQGGLYLKIIFSKGTICLYFLVWVGFIIGQVFCLMKN